MFRPGLEIQLVSHISHMTGTWICFWNLACSDACLLLLSTIMKAETLRLSCFYIEAFMLQVRRQNWQDYQACFLQLSTHHGAQSTTKEAVRLFSPLVAPALFIPHPAYQVTVWFVLILLKDASVSSDIMGFDFQEGQGFSVQKIWGPPWMLCNEYQGPFPLGESERSVKVTIYLHLVPWLRKHGTLPPFTVYSFVGWCLDTGTSLPVPWLCWH
jgi:hypothetical protein